MVGKEKDILVKYITKTKETFKSKSEEELFLYPTPEDFISSFNAWKEKQPKEEPKQIPVEELVPF